MRKFIVISFLIMFIVLISGCTSSNKSLEEQQIQSSKEENGQIPKTTTFGTGTPSSTIKEGNGIDFYDNLGKKVNSDDIIHVSKMPISPVKLFREGLIDIEVKFPLRVVKVSKIPDISKKQTFLRVKLYDQKGNIIMFRNDRFDDDIRDHPPDITFIRGNVPVYSGDYKTDIKEDNMKEWEFFIYFVDIKQDPTPKTIDI